VFIEGALATNPTITHFPANAYERTARNPVARLPRTDHVLFNTNGEPTETDRPWRPPVEAEISAWSETAAF